MVPRHRQLLRLTVLALCVAVAEPAAAPRATVRAEDVSRPLAGAYQRTQSQQISGPAVPYVEEYAREMQIDLGRIETSLFPAGFPSAGQRISISSRRRLTGNWTFVRSGSVVIYDLLKVRTSAGASLLLLLYSPIVPGAIMTERSRNAWHVALYDDQSKRLADARFPALIPHEDEGMWDMITADLTLQKGSPVVTVEYAHTGGGGGREQEFNASFAITAKPLGLRLIRSRQTVDHYP